MNGKLSAFYRATKDHVTIEHLRKDYPDASDFILQEQLRLLKEYEYWLNNEYEVGVNRSFKAFGGQANVAHLSIKRRDKQPIHDWRDLQEIKNILIGKQYEAIELYPSEDRVVDTANQYHLWVFLSVNGQDAPRFPVGYDQGEKTENPGGNAVQRKF